MVATKGKHGCIMLPKPELLPGIIFQTGQGQTEDSFDSLMPIIADADIAGVMNENQFFGAFLEYFDVLLALFTQDWDLLFEERRQVASDFIINSIMRYREKDIDVVILIIIVSTALFIQPQPPQPPPPKKKLNKVFAPLICSQNHI